MESFNHRPAIAAVPDPWSPPLVFPAWMRASRWGLVALLLCAYPLSFVVPGTWGWENGVFENMQVLVLVAGLLATLYYRRGVQEGTRSVLTGALLLWFLAAARELSWGAVFLSPLELHPTGPVFSSRQLPYHDLVHPLLALVVVCSVVMLARGGFGGMLRDLLGARRFPWFELGILVLGALGSTMAEGHLHLRVQLHVPEAQSQVVEEFMELIAYAALFLAQARFFHTLRQREDA